VLTPVNNSQLKLVPLLLAHSGTVGVDFDSQNNMTAHAKRVRAIVTGAYFIVCFAGLFYYTYGSFFCSPPRGAGHTAETLRLAVVCTVWEVLASICGAFAAKTSGVRGLAPAVSTFLALVGFVSLPFVIYDHGRFLSEGTWADVTCFFNEGFGVMFPFVVAPALAVATLVGEFVILKASGHAKPCLPTQLG
jgi:hypothetical protein